MAEIARGGLDFVLYLKLLARWSYIIVIFLTAAIIGILIFAKLQDPIYQASAKVMITESANTANGMTPYLADQVALSTANSVVQIIETENFQQQALSQDIQDLNYKKIMDLKEEIRTFSWYSLVLNRKDIITSEHVKDTAVVTIYGLGFTPSQAVDLTNSAVVTLEKSISTLYADKEIGVSDIEPAYSFDEPVFPNVQKDIAVAIAAILIISLVCVYIAGDLRTRRKFNL